MRRVKRAAAVLSHDFGHPVVTPYFLRVKSVKEQNLDGAQESKQWGSANGAVEWIGRATGLVSDKQAQATAPVTQIVINLAPGVVMPERMIIEGESRPVEE